MLESDGEDEQLRARFGEAVLEAFNHKYPSTYGRILKPRPDTLRFQAGQEGATAFSMGVAVYQGGFVQQVKNGQMVVSGTVDALTLQVQLGGLERPD